MLNQKFINPVIILVIINTVDFNGKTQLKRVSV
jgi:hypothetical protein